ncbi:coproporphyrinogen III oxidase [Portibacter lacus]|uniref:Heme chaperone HemW n=2 Tax=Portibacter lacus TaxID=1099794 RepID=A0AA37ST24_9BACT|nr:coproporphyrinogen III oxidase [Portibacter lacus]
MKRKDDMVDAIVQELRMRADYLDGSELETIYFGGGTPSVLSERELDQIFNEIYKLFSVNVKAEITLEANPDDLSKLKLSQLKQSPVNRLSIGVQSFHEAELQWMNRAHNAEESLACIEDAKSIGFTNISMDLIFGIPLSSHKLWKENVRRTIALDVGHISSYALTVEPGTALGRWVEKGKEVEAPDEYVMEQFDMGIQMLGEAGYFQYEISNFAKPGWEAVHNSNYWKSKPYLGIGPSAHSFNVGSRSMNIAHNAKYISGITSGTPDLETEIIDATTRYNEYVMTRLRTIWGIDLVDIEEFRDYFLEKVAVLLRRNWVEEKGGVYILTSEGKHFADAAAMELFAE